MRIVWWHGSRQKERFAVAKSVKRDFYGFLGAANLLCGTGGDGSVPFWVHCVKPFV